MFDNSYFASTAGGAANEWQFSTPPVTLALAATYKAALSIVAPQLCSGDILELPTMCCAEYQGGTPVRTAVGHRVVINFSLHEVQPAKLLLKYVPGDTITGEAFTRSTTAFYMTTAGVLTSAAIDAKRDNHFTVIGGTRSLLLEGSRINDFTRSQELDDAAWTKTGCTISANAGNGPDGTATADGVVESALDEQHYVLRNTPALTASTTQAFSFFAQASTRSWIRIVTADKAGTVRESWFNLTTGQFGTVNAGHTIRATAFASGWYRLTVEWGSGVGAGTPYIALALATADLITAYLGTASGLFLWGLQFETDKPFCSSYIPTTTIAVTRGADSYSLPLTTPPQEMAGYVKFVESGSAAASSRIFGVSNAADANARFVIGSTPPYSVFHSNAVTSATSTLGAGPAAGDVVELLPRLFGDGSVDILQSLNGAASTAGAQTAAVALAAAWSGPLVWLNSAGTAGSVGFTAIQSFKIVAGARSLSDMRVL